MSSICQIYGELLYGEHIYTEPCEYTLIDFLLNVNDLHTSAPVNNVYWYLYRRDVDISTTGTIDENHILVDSGLTTDNFIRISLMDYDLRVDETDYLLKCEKDSYIGHLAYTYIKYYPNQYTLLDTNIPYHQVSLNLTKEASSGGMGGSVVTHTEYKDKPLPKIKLISIDLGDELKDKEIIITNIKDFDYL